MKETVDLGEVTAALEYACGCTCTPDIWDSSCESWTVYRCDHQEGCPLFIRDPSVTEDDEITFGFVRARIFWEGQDHHLPWLIADGYTPGIFGVGDEMGSREGLLPGEIFYEEVMDEYLYPDVPPEFSHNGLPGFEGWGYPPPRRHPTFFEEYPHGYRR